MKQNTKPAANVAARRGPAPTRFVTSSANPAIKHSAPPAQAARRSPRAGGGAAKAAAASPAYTATPPMRGVGAVWNFCGPLRLS